MQEADCPNWNSPLLCYFRVFRAARTMPPSPRCDSLHIAYLDPMRNAKARLQHFIHYNTVFAKQKRVKQSPHPFELKN
jgi:hypothetical protein